MVSLYRVANVASRCRKKAPLHAVWAVPVLIIYRIFCELVWSYEIPAATQIGNNLQIDHGFGIVINKHCRIGNNCRIKHSVTIGCKTLADGTQGPSPRIGSNVDIGAGALIIGDIEIGDNVLIGAGAIVTKSVPSNSVVRGRAATFIAREESP
ncbi:hypothetical protein KAK07_07225 [Ideonella sp. 4Y16]|nr:hypothetical protein [Ideonella alba]